MILVRRLLLIVLISPCLGFGQGNFQLVGDAFGVPDVVSSACNDVDTCFTLTPNTFWQTGAVWDLQPIDLTSSFDATFCLTMGTDDFGADGFAFVMRSLTSASVGAAGEGLAYDGILPSVAIEFDTFDNGPVKDDIPADHTGLYVNNNWATPEISSIQLHPTSVNIEDGQYHTARIVWNASTTELTMYFDGFLRFTSTIDLINNVFAGATQVYWGFTASTGGNHNLQQICFPKRSISLEDRTVCHPESAELSFYTNGITSYTWTDPVGDTLVDWNTIDYPNPFDLNDTLITASESGYYTLNITFNNNTYTDSALVTIVPLPIEPFVEDSLEFCPENETLLLDAQNPGMTYYWTPDQGNVPQIQISDSEGWYTVLIEEPVNNCSAEDSVYLTEYCLPIVSFPNVFTPNGDQINDTAMPIYGVDPRWVVIENVTILNRWGNPVYSSDTEFNWDGKVEGELATEGTYFYTVRYTDAKQELEESYQGFLKLIRDN